MQFTPTKGQVEIVSLFTEQRVYLTTDTLAHRLTEMVHTAMQDTNMSPEHPREGLIMMRILRQLIDETGVPGSADRAIFMSTELYLDTNLLITLDFTTQEITLQTMSDPHGLQKQSFQHFINEYLSEARL